MDMLDPSAASGKSKTGGGHERATALELREGGMMVWGTRQSGTDDFVNFTHVVLCGNTQPGVLMAMVENNVDGLHNRMIHCFSSTQRLRLGKFMPCLHMKQRGAVFDRAPGPDPCK